MAKRLSKLMSKPPAKAMPQAVHSLLLTYCPDSLATAGVKTAVSLQLNRNHGHRKCQQSSVESWRLPLLYTACPYADKSQVQDKSWIVSSPAKIGEINFFRSTNPSAVGRRDKLSMWLRALSEMRLCLLECAGKLIWSHYLPGKSMPLSQGLPLLLVGTAHQKKFGPCLKTLLPLPCVSLPLLLLLLQCPERLTASSKRLLSAKEQRQRIEWQLAQQEMGPSQADMCT